MEIAVFGGSKTTHNFYQSAYNLGLALARKNLSIISGGYSGIMTAISEGANNANNKTINITGVLFPLPVKLKANKFLTKKIIARGNNLEQQFLWRVKRLMAADAYIFMPGNEGTLFELQTVMQIRNVQYQIQPEKKLKKIVFFNNSFFNWVGLIKEFSLGIIPPYMKINIYHINTAEEINEIDFSI